MVRLPMVHYEYITIILLLLKIASQLCCLTASSLSRSGFIPPVMGAFYEACFHPLFCSVCSSSKRWTSHPRDVSPVDKKTHSQTDCDTYIHIFGHIHTIISVYHYFSVCQCISTPIGYIYLQNIDL